MRRDLLTPAPSRPVNRRYDTKKALIQLKAGRSPPGTATPKHDFQHPHNVGKETL